MCCSIETYGLQKQSRRYQSKNNRSYIEKIDNFPLIRLPFIYRLHLETKDKDTKFIDLYLNPDELKEKIYFPLTRVLDKMLDYSVKTMENHIHTSELAYYRLPGVLHSKFLKSLVKNFGCDVKVNILYIIDSAGKIIIKPELYIRPFLFIYKLKYLQPKEFELNIKQAKTLVEMLESLI